MEKTNVITKLESSSILSSRMIQLELKENVYSDIQKTRYNYLRDLNQVSKGLVLQDILMYRAYFEQNFNVDLLMKNINSIEELYTKDVDDRTILNQAIILSVFDLLDEKLNFPILKDALLRKLGFLSF